jgi:hypothetical protein
MRFTRVSSSVHTATALPRGVRASRLEPSTIFGSFAPAPRNRRLVLERRTPGRWRRVATIRTTAHGRYHVAVSRPGAYRVRAGTVAGPAVRVR